MSKVLILIPILIILSSCEKEHQLVIFRIETGDFEMIWATDENDNNFPKFDHRLSSGTVLFTGENKMYWFDTKQASLEDFKFELPEGEYIMEIKVPVASAYGQPDASFRCEASSLEINAGTEIITVDVTPTCALFLVYDTYQQLEEGVCMIERWESLDGFPRYYPLAFDTTSNLYYTYFSPDPYPSNPSAYLWFYGENMDAASGGLSTVDFEIGKIYRIKILD